MFFVIECNYYYRRLTICDAIERSLKKGRIDERAAAAQLAALLCLQLGSTDSVDEICKCLIPSLLLIVNDHSTSPVVRTKVWLNFQNIFKS